MLLLCIDTAIEKGSFCITEDGAVLAFDQQENPKEQAGWLHQAIQTALKTTGVGLHALDAIAVSNGPGSYTGLRIGLATAKGFCYALNKPLVCLNTLQIMAGAVHQDARELICPMIDARRMEVFTGVFTKELTFYKEPFAAVLQPDSFSDLLAEHKILFTGNGTRKWAPLIAGHHNASIREMEFDARNMIGLATRNFEEKIFADVAYCEPYYVKGVYITGEKTI